MEETVADSSLVHFIIPIEKATGWPLECAECDQTLSSRAKAEVHRLETEHDHVLVADSPKAVN